MYYAQIDLRSVCIAISELSGINLHPNLIAIDRYDDTLLGKVWDGTHFINPPVTIPDPLPPIRKITHLAFMNRLTDEEMIIILTAAKTNVPIELWLRKFDAAQEIDLDDPITISGLRGLELVGILSDGRVNAILA